MNANAPIKFGIGASVRRREDMSLIRGAGTYTADVTLPGTLHAVVLRSAAANARISLSGLDEARAAPGVRLVWTSADLGGLGGLPCKARFRVADGSRLTAPPRPLLNGEMVRHVGDPIAFIVADSVTEARDAMELIAVDYDALPAIVDTAGRYRPTPRWSGPTGAATLPSRSAAATGRPPRRSSPARRMSPN